MGSSSGEGLQYPEALRLDVENAVHIFNSMTVEG